MLLLLQLPVLISGAIMSQPEDLLPPQAAGKATGGALAPCCGRLSDSLAGGAVEWLEVSLFLQDILKDFSVGHAGDGKCEEGTGQQMCHSLAG